MAKPADLRQAMCASAKAGPRNASRASKTAPNERERPKLRQTGKGSRRQTRQPHYRPGRAAKSNVTGISLKP